MFKEALLVDDGIFSIYRKHASATQFPRALSTGEYKAATLKNSELHLNAMIYLYKQFGCYEVISAKRNALCKYFSLAMSGWRIQIALLRGEESELRDIIAGVKLGAYRRSISILGSTFLAFIGKVVPIELLEIIFLGVLMRRQCI